MQKRSFLVIVLCIFAGCGKKIDRPTKSEGTKVTHIPVLRQFNAVVEGVECSVCAQDVVDMIKKIEGVDCADFILTTTDYEEGFVRFYYDVSEKNLNLRMLDETLEKQGFELTSLRGTFYLEPFSSDGRKYVALSDEVAMPFCYSNNVELLKKMIHTRPEKLFADGSIKRDPQDGTYFFTLLGQG